MVTTIRDNKEHVRRVERMINEKDLDALSEVCAEDLHQRFHGGREERRGIDEYRAYLRGVFEALPDLTLTFEEMVAEDDVVAVRYTGTGTHEGEYRGIAPTGEEVQLSGMRMVRLDDGKIVEVWGQRDDLGLLEQLGAVEPPAD